MGQTIYQVDAFTNRPFAGNPAGVCILSEARDAQWMQDVAKEMNLSETAFLLKRDDGYNLRWFTPTVEVELCGHATLASAHILWETGLLSSGEQARSSDYDFVSRFFAPTVGVNEDPVTDSAHCCLSQFWSNTLAYTTPLPRSTSRGVCCQIGLLRIVD